MAWRKILRGTRIMKQQKGQAMMEYVIIAFLLIVALLVPFSDDDGENKSLADRLVEAVKKNHEAKVFAIGNPVVGSLSIELPSP